MRQSEQDQQVLITFSHNHDHDSNLIHFWIHYFTNLWNGVHMAYKDGETFTTYCDKDYDRHTYTIVLKNGEFASIHDYETLQQTWYYYRDQASHIVVVDKAGVGF